MPDAIRLLPYGMRWDMGIGQELELGKGSNRPPGGSFKHWGDGPGCRVRDRMTGVRCAQRGGDIPSSVRLSHSLTAVQQSLRKTRTERSSLPEGGEKSRICGWLKDRFGLFWQFVPRVLSEMFRDDKRGKSRRPMKAMLQMKKPDISLLQRAYNDKQDRTQFVVALW